MTDPTEKLTHEMSDADLAEHEASIEAAMSTMFSGVPVAPVDNTLEDEAEDEDGDLIEYVSRTDRRSLGEALADDIDDGE